MRSVRSTVERRFESYSGSCFFGDESRVCCGCGAGSSLRPSLFDPSLHLFYYGVTHVIIVACPHPLHIYCPHPLSCCIYTPTVPLLFGTVIPTPFTILMEMFLLPLHILHNRPIVVQIFALGIRRQSTKHQRIKH